MTEWYSIRKNINDYVLVLMKDTPEGLIESSTTTFIKEHDDILIHYINDVIEKHYVFLDNGELKILIKYNKTYLPFLIKDLPGNVLISFV